MREMKKIIINNEKKAKISQWYLKNRLNRMSCKLKFGVSTVGRGANSTIHINVSGLSKDHAEFHVMNERIWIVDKSKLGVYVNQIRIKKNEFTSLNQGDIITFGVDLSKKDNHKHAFKLLSFELKFKLSFIDLTLSDNDSENENDDHKKDKHKHHKNEKSSLKVLIKTSKNGLKSIENIPKHRKIKRSASRSNTEPSTCCSSAESSASHSSTDGKKEKKIKKEETNTFANDINNFLGKTFEGIPQNVRSPQNDTVRELPVVETSKPSSKIMAFESTSKSPNDRSPRNETVHEKPMVEIPKNSHLNKSKSAIVIDALPQMNGKRRSSENIQSSSKIMAYESTSKTPVRESPVPMQSPYEIAQDELITKMINWNYMHMKAGQKYTTKLSMIPPKAFESLETFKNMYTTLIESTLWHFAKKMFSTIISDMSLIFSDSLSENSNGTILTEFIFISNGNARPQPNEFFLMETINKKGKKINFFAYVMCVKINTIDLLMLSSYDARRNENTLKIVSRCSCESLMNYYKTIESMESIGSPSILDSLIHPTTLSLLIPKNQCHNKCIFGKSKQCINPLNEKQYEVFWGAYNNALDIIKLTYNKVLVTLVNGVPGSGKSLILLELLIALSCTQDTTKPTKILITAATDEEIDVLAFELHKIRQFKLDLSEKLNFIRYGEVSRNYRELLTQYLPWCVTNNPEDYKKIVENANIIFCHPRNMHKLHKQYVKKVDVCMVDNASRMVEYESIIPVIFAPKVFLLFGNQKTKPSDNLNMNSLYPGLNVHQTIFERMFKFKKDRNQTIFTLDKSYRFESGINHFLNAQFYDNKMIHHSRNNNTDYNNNSHRSPLADFRLIHIDADALIVNLLQKMINVANPQYFKYAIIVPPKCRDKLDVIPFHYRRHFIISTNNTFNPRECDIMIIWSNEEMINSDEYSPDRLHYAMTKVKRSLFIVGNVSQLAMNKEWMPVYTYASAEKKYFSTSLKDLEKDFAEKLLVFQVSR